MHQILTITVTGPDAFEFLQAQLTNDLMRLDAEGEILAAWCNPKGRVIWFGTVWNIDGGYGLSVIADMADDIVKRLTMFRFRSKVNLRFVYTCIYKYIIYLFFYGYYSERGSVHFLHDKMQSAQKSTKIGARGYKQNAPAHIRWL